MTGRFLFRLLQLRKRLWARPLLFCLLAVVAAFLAHLADAWPSLGPLAPDISPETIERLLTIISSSMLAVATFAVGSMISAYASASAAATPRAFALVLADDVSQKALSAFIGAFIFSIVAIIALKTGLYGRAGLFGLFCLTLLIFAWVVLTFVRWVDNIARLGQLGSTIDKAERAARDSLAARRRAPCLGGVEQTGRTALSGHAVTCSDSGYVQFVDMAALQDAAEKADLRMMVEAVPGSFLAPGGALVRLDTETAPDDDTRACIAGAFVIGSNRTFEEDPRFGLIVLAEIAARALSPGVNDPGTAIVIIGRFVRLLAGWLAPREGDAPEVRYDRIVAPALETGTLFDDAFTAIARDGAGQVEVGTRLMEALASLAALDHPDAAAEARRHADLALRRAKSALTLEDDYERLRALADRVG